MKDSIKEQMNAVFSKNNGYAVSKDIKESGFSKYVIKKFEEDGVITRIKRGVYRWNNYEDYNEYRDISRVVPNGVLCLVSALSYYNLTTYTPSEYHIALERNMKVKTPSYPPIKIYYFSKKYYSEGITEVDIDGSKLKVYDIEKTICDCFRYRNQIGKDILLESLKEYSLRKDKNVSKFMKYAKFLHIEKQIKQYMEAFLYE